MIHVVLSNAVSASALAAAVFLCSRFIRNPMIVHILWVVVILRFLAPPLVNVPFGFAIPGADAAVATAPREARDNARETPVARTQELASTTARPPMTVSHRLALTWAAGALLILVVAIVRGIRLRSLSRRAGVNSADLQRKVQIAGKEMGLRQTPEALLVRARISPMVWCWFFRPVMLLPMELWTTLSEDEKSAVIRHELAHLVRRDHWVRLAEALATVTHWWCPVLWWARRELHRYEERCCDGLAVSSGPESRAALAQACLRTIDFIGRKPFHEIQFGVSRMAGFHSIRQRIDFILEGEHMHAFSPRATVGLFIVVSLALGVSPGFGESHASEQEMRAIAVPDTFESLRVVGGVDVDIQFSGRRKVTLSKTRGREPTFTVDDEKRLVITLDKVLAKRAKQDRPKVVITSPTMVIVEAKANAAVSVRKVEVPVMVFAIEGHSRVAADGHCKSLTVTADKSGSFLGAEMTAAAAVVTANRNSTVSIGTVQSLIQNTDATSTVEVGGSNVVSVRLSKS